MNNDEQFRASLVAWRTAGYPHPSPEFDEVRRIAKQGFNACVTTKATIQELLKAEDTVVKLNKEGKL
jgi:hypothetical protein